MVDCSCWYGLWFVDADFCLKDLEGFGGLVAFGLLAFGDGLGDGFEHAEGLVTACKAPGGIGISTQKALEVAGINETIVVFFVYLSGFIPILPDCFF